MAARKPAATASTGLSAEERAAVRERARELKAEAAKADGEKELLAKVKAMGKRDRVMAERIHAIVTAAAPELAPKTWYGMPAYARDGSILCFFKPAEKFNTRYATFGFTDKAHLDEGTMWPAEFALLELTPADEKRLATLIKQAVR